VTAALPIVATKPELATATKELCMEISCDNCVMEHTNACEDCVVRFIVDRRPGEAIVIDVEEERAVRMLSDAGLVPELRHRRARAG
jgi:hypothetical protein